MPFTNYGQYMVDPGGFRQNLLAERERKQKNLLTQEEREMRKEGHEAEIAKSHALTSGYQMEQRNIQREIDRSEKMHMFKTMGMAVANAKDQQSWDTTRNWLNQLSSYMPPDVAKSVQELPEQYDEKFLNSYKNQLNTSTVFYGGEIETPKKTPTQQDYEYAVAQGYKGSYAEWAGKAGGPKKIEKTVDLGDRIEYQYSDGTTEFKMKGQKPGGGGPKDESALRKEFQAMPIVKDFNTIESQKLRLDKAMEENKKGGSKIAVDQALITILNKMLDPSSVVRESEYARTPGDMALMDQIKGKAQKWTTGGAGLTDNDRAAIYQMTNKFYEVAQTKYREQADFYTRLATDYGYKPTNVVRPGSKGKGKPKDKEQKQRFKILGVE